jgi:hypothetical protein
MAKDLKESFPSAPRASKFAIGSLHPAEHEATSSALFLEPYKVTALTAHPAEPGLRCLINDFWPGVRHGHVHDSHASLHLSHWGDRRCLVQRLDEWAAPSAIGETLTARRDQRGARLV